MIVDIVSLQFIVMMFFYSFYNKLTLVILYRAISTYVIINLHSWEHMNYNR